MGKLAFEVESLKESKAPTSMMMLGFRRDFAVPDRRRRQSIHRLYRHLNRSLWVVLVVVVLIWEGLEI